MPPFTNSFFLFFVLWHINWFTSVQFCNCRNKVKFSVKTFLQWMGDRDVSGTARRRLFFVYCVVFVKLFLNGSALRMTFAHSVWTLALLDGDRRTWWWWWWWWCRRNWGEFLWIWGTGNDFFFFFCSVWNVKVCLDWNGHSDLFSSAFWTHSSSDWTTSVSHRNSYVYETTTASRQTNNPKHWDLLPFHLPCLPSSCYPA